jgi:NTP pyrophosphatase (non-canonical NTP hydrolase)
VETTNVTAYFTTVPNYPALGLVQTGDDPTPRAALREEAKEAVEALEALRHADTPTRPDLVEHVAKELADVLCVTYGAAAALGIPMDAVYREVHASNMTKVGGSVRADGKMLKGDSYRPPDLPRVLNSSGRDWPAEPRLVAAAGPRLPAVTTPERDINPICGHWLGNRCDGCMTCTTCDGCHCDEVFRRWMTAACHSTTTRPNATCGW